MAIMQPIEFILKVPHIESVNSMYEPNFKFLKSGKQIYSGMRLSDAASRMKNSIIHQVDSLNLKTRSYDLNYPFKLQLIYILNRNILKRDLDNFQKLVQDGIFTALRINDSRIFEINSKKTYLKASSEYIKVRLGQLPTRIDLIKVE